MDQYTPAERLVSSRDWVLKIHPLGYADRIALWDTRGRPSPGGSDKNNE